MTILSQYQFAIRHPQRTYESMISLMFKYPWNYTGLYTLGERNRIFKCVLDQITALTSVIHSRGPDGFLTIGLLQELVTMGLKCAGFSDRQRASLIDASQGIVKVEAFVTPFAKEWVGEVISIKQSASHDMVAVR